jgi:hypothetical protein
MLPDTLTDPKRYVNAFSTAYAERLLGTLFAETAIGAPAEKASG